MNNSNSRILNEKLIKLDTNELIQLLMDIDNGFIDDIIDTHNKYNTLEYYRKQIIEIIDYRYVSTEPSNRDKDLETAYNCYLRYYS